MKSIPNFPINDYSGKEIVVNLKEKLKESGFADKVESGEISLDDIEKALEDNITDATKPKPTEPTDPDHQLQVAQAELVVLVVLVLPVQAPNFPSH